MNSMIWLFLILAQSSFAQTSLDGLQTGRYEIHPSSLVTAAASPVVKKSSKKRGPASESPVEAAELKPVPTVPAPVAENSHETEREKTEPSLIDQAKSIVHGQADQIYDFYQEQVHPDDVRNNRVEIDFSPGLIYNDSKSSYSYRNYTSTFPALDLGAKIWFTPLIGLSGNYFFSFAADVSGDSATRSRLAAHYESLDLALHLRRFYGLSRKANSLDVTLLYIEDKLDVPSDNTARAKLRSSGFGLGLEGKFPTSASYAWTLGGRFYPRVQHREMATGANIQSGGGAESARLGLDLGGEFKFSRASQLVWGLDITAEKNLFSGSAQLPDPENGQTPSQVGVMNTFYMFHLGYRWGQ